MNNIFEDNFEFDDAYAQLLEMVKSIESDTVSLKDLSKKIAEAQSLVQKCEQELRDTSDQINQTPEDVD